MGLLFQLPGNPPPPADQSPPVLADQTPHEIHADLCPLSPTQEDPETYIPAVLGLQGRPQPLSLRTT